MKFCWSTLRVTNLEESVAFYRDIVGLEVVRRFSAGPATEIVFMGGGGETQLELICDRPEQKIDIGSDISWGFEVKSLDETLKMIRQKGIALDGELSQPNPQVRFFFVRDPNGMRIQFVENK